MNAGFPQSVVLTLAILATAAPAAVAGTPRTDQDARLTVSVTVPPICTVAVSEGVAADEAVVLQCRNLPDDHPEPRVDDAAPVVSDDAATSTQSVTMVVINF